MKKLLLPLLLLCSLITLAQTPTASQYNSMQWRMIGPYRGGRTVGAVGVPQQPNVFYIGVNNGGVWKTTDYGRTWFPIFDDQPTGSIGDVAVAPSDPNVVYVGCGEGLQRPDLSVGNGMYRSSDAGKTWTHLGLDDVQQIGGLAVDPTNPDRIFVAGLGHPYGPNTERGVYRSTNGGKTWEKVLYKDENTGAVQVAIDPKDPNIVYADMWAGRQGPWENGAWNGPESGLYKSTDGGTTWKKLTNGLPTPKEGLGRIGFCIAPSNTNRLYATVDAGQPGGLYRSDDGGESWKRMVSDNRYWGRAADFAEVRTDPKNADIVYTANVVTWKSTDGGSTWKSFRGAPGGDDYHRIWINPNDSKIILIASDQGAIITVNGGETFSSWYNQPTAQFYHVSTDNAFPYNVYGGQQESGSAGVASRGNDGAVTYRDWHPVGAEEYAYVAADPLDPSIIYGGKISRYDKRTGQTQNIAPEPGRGGKYRFIRTAPVLFSPVDNKTLYYAGNVIFKTLNGGQSWDVISPDLTRESWDVPASVGIYTTKELSTMPRRGVIYTIAPSLKNINTIWCGTDDGLIHITRDGGKSWKNITPEGVTSWSKVSLMDAGHFDDNTVYAAVNRIRCDDMHPHIYRTHDGGKTWKEIVNGLPDDPINVVREDPQQKGLLFAGSERFVYVSFDDGDHWQSLRLNMPATSIRDLVIKDDDVVIGTHGRGFWILDNITSLRQLAASKDLSASVILYKPQSAYRIRWSMYTDTPVPQEESAGQNPPDGAMIDYYLANGSGGEVRLEISIKNGGLVRSFSSNDKPYPIPENLNIPEYWIRPQQILSGTAGSHRFLWDMKYPPLDIPASYPIGANYRNTAPDQTAPWVLPGEYEAKLIVDGRTYTQTFTIKMDPRVKISAADLQKQYDIGLEAYAGRISCMNAQRKITEFRNLIKAKLNGADAATTEKLNMLDKEAASIMNGKPGSNDPSFGRLNGVFATVFNIVQDAERPVTVQVKATHEDAKIQLGKLQTQWLKLRSAL